MEPLVSRRSASKVKLPALSHRELPIIIFWWIAFHLEEILTNKPVLNCFLWSKAKFSHFEVRKGRGVVRTYEHFKWRNGSFAINPCSILLHGLLNKKKKKKKNRKWNSEPSNKHTLHVYKKKKRKHTLLIMTNQTLRLKLYKVRNNNKQDSFGNQRIGKLCWSRTMASSYFYILSVFLLRTIRRDALSNEY